MAIFNTLFSLIFSLFGYTTHAQDSEKLWFETAQKMGTATSPEEMQAILDAQVPSFRANLEKDSKNRELLNLWGTSRNIDASQMQKLPEERIKTVPPSILAYLNSILNVDYDQDFIFGHAGLTHTYGYMMSNMSTPYGYKRARYVLGETEQGFGLPDILFAGVPAQGTLLSNMTHFAGMIAFRDHPEVMDGVAASEVPEISQFNYSALKIERLVELVMNENFTLELRTDIVPFTQKNTRGSNTALLVYSVDFHAQGQNSQPRLITAFPVNSDFAHGPKGIFRESEIGDQKVIELKYNASLSVSLPPEQMIGKRYIANEAASAQYYRQRHQAKF